MNIEPFKEQLLPWLWPAVFCGGIWVLGVVIRLWAKWNRGFPSPLRTLALIIVATLIGYGLVIATLGVDHTTTSHSW